MSAMGHLRHRTPAILPCIVGFALKADIGHFSGKLAQASPPKKKEEPKWTRMFTVSLIAKSLQPWNKGKLTGAKPPLRPKHVWAVRTRLQLLKRFRDLALFNLAIDSKLRGCDVVRPKGR